MRDVTGNKKVNKQKKSYAYKHLFIFLFFIFTYIFQFLLNHAGVVVIKNVKLEKKINPMSTYIVLLHSSLTIRGCKILDNNTVCTNT